MKRVGADVSTNSQPLFPEAFLASCWANEFSRFRGSADEASLLKRLHEWADRKAQKETTAEGAFVSVFFKQTWGYRAAGEGASSDGYTCEPQYAIKGAGQQGGTGVADLAIAHFGHAHVPPIPQVLCEFKDVRSDLDKPQKRKGNDRSPVKQCADYIREATAALFGNEPVQPTWGIVSDMNEFRLYWRKNMPTQFQRFVVRAPPGDQTPALIGDGDASAFQRFVFWRMFQRDMLLSTGGPSPLERLLNDQWVQERTIENDFYREYQAFRQELFEGLVQANPEFKGSKGRLVRLTQRLLDRCIFILFCEDMGAALNFPPHVLRDVLVNVSRDPDYDGHDDAAYIKVRKLFASMRDGSPFREHRINRFNGGLFAVEPELEALHVPTRLFCAQGQGASAAALTLHKKTLLYFSANYNFGVTGGTFQRTIGLYTLGRIFEQSITELEFMEAKADGRASISELSKRKRDGVYYTPEWVTSYVVEEVVGARLAEIRRDLALDPMPAFTDDEIAHYRRARASGKRDKRFNTERVSAYVESLDRYAGELDDLKVVDPACGSGAFLVQVLDRLVKERRWLALEREKVLGTTELFDLDTVMKAVLSQNVYGVDINEESIEITRLALWLHTALPDRPLSSLDDNIRCGNSLVGSDFYATRQPELFSEGLRERINVFDWKTAFPKVFGRPGVRSGFDCVVGNPPYVKLQHFRTVLPEVAAYLQEARAPGTSEPLYASTQSRNYDMYLPFIERGLDLLNKSGKMGYIAPSVWLISEYGEGLRKRLLQSKRLDRWVDFKDHPVFDEAMTYTALQFFSGDERNAVRVTFAPKGEVGAIEWDAPDASMSYASFPVEEPWILLADSERSLLRTLSKNTERLENVASGISVGIQTSADHIYHLDRIGPDRYQASGQNAGGTIFEIEDSLMRPLISGEEAKRYLQPMTATCLLFPYDDTSDRPRLFTATEMDEQFPKGWGYLKGYEQELRARERRKMDRDTGWWGYNYPKNIDKQKLPKLGVAQTVPEMRVFYDERGEFCFNNVRVNAILATQGETAWFLMGVLNSRVVDFVFRRIAKPKEPRPSGAYFEANKQYIAPLPIPKVTDSDRDRVAERARTLQEMHSRRRDLIASIDQRLNSSQMISKPKPAKWLWADVRDVKHWETTNRTGLTGRTLTQWAKAEFEARLAAHIEAIGAKVSWGATMAAALVDGELRFYAGDHCVVSGVYPDEREAPLILAQWRQRARERFVSDTVNAARIVEWLLDLKTTENNGLIAQIDQRVRELDALEAQIRIAERALDDLMYELFKLTPHERAMVEADTRARWNARLPLPST